MLHLRLITIALFAAGVSTTAADDRMRGTIVTEHLLSENLRDTRTGLDPNRLIKVYLPPGYEESGKAYPVVYFFHSLFWSPEKMFEDGNLVRLLERGFADGMVDDFIFVAADYSTPTAGSFFENSAITGRWIDFTVKELVPFIDEQFRTIQHRDSRGLAGDGMGGYGALKFSMLYPELFNAVYALHPVATGTGGVPMASTPDWQAIHRARSFDDLEDDRISQVFIAMAQAYLPNPNRQPFYCDFMMELENGEPTLHLDNAKKLKAGFLLDQILTEADDNLRQVRAIAFDWARYDPIQDHVYANQTFTRKLDELGIEHTAEEYGGVQWIENWSEHGRFFSRLLPFFARHLAFEDKTGQKV